ncbi:MAG: methylamine dehydrogenase (amicyanin) light chain [Deltaproteobacteria bacterium]|nr:methylamine dehydrogenase (amicyanin) light chain [Deltaproteobacteria bacterium]MBW2415985.1 methylamine dehydrogenase (amicyanin) light chain [Deltaproteobacteria bacterium]
MGLQDRIDRWLGGASRQLARKTSRRGFLARVGGLGVVTAGASALPLLPVRRAFAQREPAPGEPAPGTPQGDPNACEYWRYCSIDGFLSSCCGGTHRSCPPGTEMSAITWVGTCRNPKDGKDYVISYNDCCGKDTCGRCFCHRNEGDKPVYLPQRSNDINWCMGTREAGVIYNSTVSIVIGVATEDER